MFLIPVLLTLFSACYRRGTVDTSMAEELAAREEQAALERAELERAAWIEALRLEAWRLASALDDRQLAAQVIISGIDGKGRLTQDMRLLLDECPAGGIMLFRYNIDTDNDAIKNLTAETAALISSLNGIPPFMAIDHEGGAVNRFRRGVADLPAAASYWELSQNTDWENALERTTIDSFNAGMALNTLGINLNLAPVAEYLNDDNYDFLDDRSYGPHPDFTAEAAAAFIAGMEQAGVLCVVKHFPGSAGSDPHRYPSELYGDKAALDELVSPIAALIREGRTHAIMVSHSAVPAMDTRIASLSPVIMGEWLRQELGFEGIIICDDFSMAAASGSAAGGGRLRPEAAAVLSLAAGADMVLVWPPDLRRTHRAIAAALDSGAISRERVQEAAERIIFEKIRMGIIEIEELETAE